LPVILSHYRTFAKTVLLGGNARSTDAISGWDGAMSGTIMWFTSSGEVFKTSVSELIALGWVSIARDCRAQLFVRSKLVRFYRVRVQHRSAAAACGCWWTLSLRHKTVSTERAQHTEIPLPRDKEPLRFDSTRQWYRLCEAKEWTLPRAAATRNQYRALNDILINEVLINQDPRCTGRLWGPTQLPIQWISEAISDG
jgi:hypothetical protein